MLETNTPAVDRALMAAQVLAQQQHMTEVEPLHLLFGLLQEEQGRPFVLLREAGMNPDLAAKSVPSLVGKSPLDGTALPLSGQTTAALRQAQFLCREIAGESTISSEQVLLGLLQEEEDLRQLLGRWGLAFATLEATVMAAIQGPLLALEEPLDLVDDSARMDLARIVDAGANWAREALRVLKDYCRFVLDDAFLSRELKTLRHDLAAVLGELSVPHLLSSRETLRDVGTEFDVGREPNRHSLEEVVLANFKRLQEAMRSLEEYGKVYGSALGSALEQIRYRTYTLERMLLLGREARRRLADVRLYMLVSGALCQGPLEWTIREAAAGGVQMFQLREKTLHDRALLERARQVRRWTREVGALLIVNDRPDIARLVTADGVHLGQEELPVKEARRLLGSEAIVGVSTHDVEQVHQALRDGATYIGVGPTFPSQTKEFGEFPGLEFVRQASAETSLPAFVIGGVTLGNMPEVLSAGGRRVAVSQSLCRSEAPQALAHAMRQLLDAVE